MLLVVEGMHCPSCVRAIEDLLSEHRFDHIVVSLFAGTVAFDSHAPFSLPLVLRDLADCGFHAVLPDKVTSAGEAPHSRLSRSSWAARFVPSERSKRRKHKALCEACRFSQSAGSPAISEKKSASLSEEGTRWTETTFGIGGMTCGSCTSSLQAGLQDNAIRNVEVTLLPGRATIVHNAQELSVDALRDLINNLGYEAHLDDTARFEKNSTVRDVTNGPHRVKLSVTGMTCASCTGAVSSVLKAHAGVTNVSVQLMSGIAMFETTHGTDAVTIRTEVEELGYDCEVLENEPRSVDGQEPGHVSARALRTSRFRVDGMFCSECPVKVNATLAQMAEEHPQFTFTPLTRRLPFTTISYAPDAPRFTGRTIRKRVAELGLHLVHAPIDSIEQRSAATRAKAKRSVLMRLLLAFLFAIPTFIIAVVGMSLVAPSAPFRTFWEEPVWGTAPRGEVALWALATPVQFGVGSIFYARSWKSLRAVWRRKRTATPWRAVWFARLFRWGSMDSLVALGTTLAYVASLAFLIVDVLAEDMGMREARMGYFDTSVFLIMFILAGRYLEALSKQRTGDAITELNRATATTGFLFTASEGATSALTEEVDAAFLEIGDLLLVAAGSSPPLDGILADDSTPALFDDSMLTGEARPVLKQPGDAVYAGTINSGPAAARLRLTSHLGGSMVDGIASAVREAMGKKAGIERIADTVTAYFVPAIVGIACLTLGVWLLRGYTGGLPAEWLSEQQRGQGGWALFGIEFAVAVLVVACPCGIGLAAPTAQLVGVGLAAKNGILPNGGGEAFQAYSRANVLVLDKTGTLTTSAFRVSDAELLVDGAEDRALLWSVMSIVEAASSHPLSVGIRKRCEVEAQGSRAVDLVTSEEVAGRGLVATVTAAGAPYEVVIGNEALMTDLGAAYASVEIEQRCIASMTSWQSEAKSVILLALRRLDAAASPLSALSDDKLTVLALFGLHDPPRDEAAAVVAELRSRGIEVWMCTGDNTATAQAVATRVGINPACIQAHALPEDKRSLVQRLQGVSKRRVVAFCGDGINDSPALAQADAGIAMGGGSAVALRAAHFTLVGSSLWGLVTLRSLSRSTIRKIYANFAWASVYNVVLIPLAAGAFYPLGQTRLPAVWASLAMALSSVSVILNSLLLRATFRLPTVVREAQRPAATTRAATPTSWTGSEAGPRR